MNLDIIHQALLFAVDNGFVFDKEELTAINAMIEAINEGRVQIVAKVP